MFIGEVFIFCCALNIVVLGILVDSLQDVRFSYDRTSFSCSGEDIYTSYHDSSMCYGSAVSYKVDGLSLTPPVPQPQPQGYALSGLFMRGEPVTLMNASAGMFASFDMNTSFVIINTKHDFLIVGDGMAFVMAPRLPINFDPGSCKGGNLGVYNATGKWPEIDKSVVVEFDVYKNYFAYDMNDNHVGINVMDNITSIVARDAGEVGVALSNGSIVNSRILYDASLANLSVQIGVDGQELVPFLSIMLNLSEKMGEIMYVGFAAGIGTGQADHRVLEWSFLSYGLDPEGPIGRVMSFKAPSAHNNELLIGVAAASALISFLILAGLVLLCWKFSRRIAESMALKDDIRVVVNLPHKFTYEELNLATDGFSETTKLGHGAFGDVHLGVLVATNTKVAVKKLHSQSRQGEKEFLAEVSTISLLRHRNLVQLVGWCKKADDFLLVYEYLSNGSLDKAILHSIGDTLPWAKRFHILTGIAAALQYLHEGWHQQVIHRDVKSSNVMLDENYNAKLGDFGLARLIEHDVSAAEGDTAHAAGTKGYMAPETFYSRKFTDKTDVFSFGALALETACGRDPLDPGVPSEEWVLVDFVWSRYINNSILSAVDEKLHGNYNPVEAERVLLVGLLCTQPNPKARPFIRRVHQILSGDFPVPALPSSKPDLRFTTGMEAHFLSEQLERTPQLNHQFPTPTTYTKNLSHTSKRSSSR